MLSRTATCLIVGLFVFVARTLAAEPTTRPAESTVMIDAFWARCGPGQLPVGKVTVPASLLTDPKVIYARAHAVGYADQEVTIEVTHTANVVTGATPIVAPGVSTYEFNTAAEKFGVMLVETPSKVTNDSVQLTFDSTVTMPQENPPAAVAERGPSTEPVAQNNAMSLVGQHGLLGTSSIVLHSKSTVTLQPGVPTIVSAMSDHPGEPGDQVLCLVICATVTAGK